LEYAVTNCPYLHQFEIEFRMDMLKLSRGTFIAGKSRKSIPPTPQQNITEIKLEGAEISQELLGLLTTYLPKLEHLEYSIGIHDCSGDNNIIHFNFTTLSRLNKLTIDVGNLILNGFDFLFFRFKYFESDNISDCFMIEEKFSDEEDDDTEKYEDGIEYKSGYQITPTTESFIDFCSEDQSLQIYIINAEFNAKINEINFLRDGLSISPTLNIDETNYIKHRMGHFLKLE
jgi:hypothetical protein